MDSDFYRELLKLAELLSFSEAAEALNMTQSNLSKHIRIMEKELGHSLFDRSSHPIRLSRFGTVFLPYAQEAANACAAAEEAAKKYTRDVRETVRIAVVHNMEFYNIDLYLDMFRKAHHECTVRIIEADEKKIRSMFASDQIHLMTYYVFPEDEPPEGFIPVQSAEIVAVFPPGHPIFGAESVPLSAICSEPLLLPNHDTNVAERLRTMLEQAGGGAPLNVIYEGNSFSGIHMAMSGMGVALQPDAVLDAMDEVIPRASLTPKIVFMNGLMHKPLRNLSAGDRKLVRYAGEHLRYREEDKENEEMSE